MCAEQSKKYHLNSSLLLLLFKETSEEGIFYLSLSSCFAYIFKAFLDKTV